MRGEIVPMQSLYLARAAQLRDEAREARRAGRHHVAAGDLELAWDAEKTAIRIRRASALGVTPTEAP